MRQLKILDSHTGGEPTRLVMAGLPDDVFSGTTSVCDRLALLRDQHDWVRTALCNEPRGSEVMVGAALVEPQDKTCQVGVIYFNNAGYLGMCGHGTIGLLASLAHAGKLAPGTIKIETPVGVISATLHDDLHRVTLTNIPSFRFKKAVPVEVPGLGKIHGDIAWGGNWFFLVSDHGVNVEAQNIPALMAASQAIQAQLDAQGICGEAHLNGGVIDHVELFGPPTSAAEGDSRSFVLCPGAQYDRSPCGTGTSAKLACLAADGKLPAGKVWRQQSVIGSVFEAAWQFPPRGPQDPPADPSCLVVIPSITGSAFVNAEVTAVFDAADPFADGIAQTPTTAPACAAPARMKSGPKHTLVIGSGIIGAASAYSLAKAGVKVTLVDQGAFGSGCSHANCGYVSPSHVLPLCTPGAVAKTLKFALRPNSPFRIAPSLDFKLWKFLAQFALNCDDKKAIPAGHARKAMIERSTALYGQFLAAEKLDCGWENKGCIFTNETAAGFKGYSQYVAQLEDTFDQDGWVKLEGDALWNYEPAIKPGSLAGGWLFKGDAHMQPDRLMDCYKTALERLGVTILEHTKVLGLRKENGKAVAARVDTGKGLAEISADAFVVATGAWTPLLNQALGFQVPIQPGKGYSITMSRPTTCPKTPLIFQDVKVAITPFADSYRIGSLMEFAGYDTSLKEKRLQLLRDGAARYLHTPMGEEVKEEWYGWRPMTPTGKPIIGFAPAAGNLVVAAGHNMEGMCMGSATGEMVMQLLTGQQTTVDAGAFAVGG